MMPVVILCGGLSTRLYPSTIDKPKSMVEVLGKPFIDHQLTLLQKNDVKEVILCIGKFGEQIKNYVSNGERWNISIKYSDDGEKLLGTGGALLNAYPILPDEFILMYGDSYLDFDYTKAIKRFYYCEKPLLISMFPVNLLKILCYGNVYEIHGRIFDYNKNADYPYVDYGFTIMRKEVLSKFFIPLPVDIIPLDLSIIYKNAIRNGIVSCYVPSKVFYEIGSPEGLKLTTEYIRSKI